MKFDQVGCLCWILVSTRRDHSKADEKGQELNSEDVDILEITVVVSGDCLCWS